MVCDLLYKYRFGLILLTLCAVGLSLPLVKNLKTDATNNSVLEHDEAYEQNEFFQKTFGSDDLIVIGLGNTDVLSAPALKWIRALSKQLNENKHILNTESVIVVPRIERKLHKVSSEPMGDRYFSGKESLGQFIKQLQLSSELSHHLVSEDGTFAVVIANLRSPLSPSERKQVLEETETWIKVHEPSDGKVYLSGTAVEQDRFIKKIQHDHAAFVPITFALIMVTLLVLHGHLSALLYPGVVIITTLVTTQAIMVMADISLNIMTTLVSPVILIVAVGDVLHLQSHARHLDLKERPGQLLRSTFRSLATPCLLTTLTTMAGFLSLSFNRVPAVRDFGWFAALGTALAFIWTFFLAPVFMTLHVKKRLPAVHQRWSYAATGLSGIAVKFRKVILLGGLVALILGVFGVQRVQVETDILGSFKAEDTFRQDTEMFHQKLGGVYPLELVLHSPGFDSFSNPDTLKRIDQLKEAILGLPGVSNVKYLTDVIHVIDRGVLKQDSLEKELPPEKYLTRYLTAMEENAPMRTRRVASDGYEWTRMSAFLTLSSTAAVINIAEQIQKKAAEILPEGWSLFVAGQTYLLARMSQRLVVTEVQSILIAMGVIWLLLVLWSKSLKVGIISLFVNLIPLVVVLGGMPLLNIKLNTATAMIGAVAVGLIVDNTIHVLFRFREVEPSFSGSQKAIEHVMNYCAQPMISATLVLMIGFSVTLMGSIKPTVQFGILMILITFAALISNLFVLPAILVGRRRPLL